MPAVALHWQRVRPGWYEARDADGIGWRIVQQSSRAWQPRRSIGDGYEEFGKPWATYADAVWYCERESAAAIEFHAQTPPLPAGGAPELEIGVPVVVLAYRHDFGISDLRGVVAAIGERFVTVAVTPDETQRGLGIAAVDVSPDRLELVAEVIS